ncbi:MAG: hypothetical protein QOJ65_1166 [Fimbriimonadaceae bacterium]|jgi:hypothetical protein|nr:hypothetical protein [Fimbriimonadaceae bacterium]
MKLKLLLAISLSAACLTGAVAQTIDPDKSKESTRIVQAMRKVELMNQILPLVLERDQILQILPVLERIRDKNRRLLIQEHDDLLKYDKQSTAAVDAAMKGKLPDQNFVRELVAFYRVNDLRRQIAMGENIDLLLPALDKALNKGQQKVMANSLTLKFFEPDITPEQATDKLKIRVFVREVLLDPLTYELLVAMAK